MRSQWCREHIDQTAKECGLEKSVVSEVKIAAEFCVEHSAFADCGTRAITTLIRVRDDPVRERAIQWAEKALNKDTHVGKNKKDLLTETEIKKIIQKAEMEVRGELSKKYAEDRKNNPPAKSEEKKEPPKKEIHPAVQPDPEPAPIPPAPPVVDNDKMRRERIAAKREEITVANTVLANLRRELAELLAQEKEMIDAERIKYEKTHPRKNDSKPEPNRETQSPLAEATDVSFPRVTEPAAPNLDDDKIPPKPKHEGKISIVGVKSAPLRAGRLLEIKEPITEIIDGEYTYLDEPAPTANPPGVPE